MKNLAFIVPCLLICLASPSYGQQPATFPPEAKVVTGDGLKALVSGKTFRAQPSSGPAWKIQYRDNGFAYLDVANGYRDTGKWRIDGGMLCADWQKTANPTPCNEVREISPGTLILLRGNGELLTMKSE